MIRETDVDRLVRLCNRDIRRAVEEGRFIIETPTRSVEQSELRGLEIRRRQPTETVWQHGQPETVAGPPLLGLEFGLPMNYESVMNDLAEFETDTIVYGDLHVWRLTDAWQSEITHEGHTVGEKTHYAHSHEWGTVEEIDWRTDV